MNKRKLKDKDVIVFIKHPIGVDRYYTKNTAYFPGKQPIVDAPCFIGKIGIVVELDPIRVLAQCDNDGFGLIVDCNNNDIEYIGKL